MMQPERAETRIVDLAQEGFRPSMIAELVGCPKSTVYHYLWLARKRGMPIPKFKTGSGWTGGRFLVPLDPALKPALAAAAALRGIDPREMARRLLCACIDGGLIDAVLDDNPEPHDGDLQ